MVTIEYEKILNSKDKYTLVDTRSPREYEESTIPNAINIPLFTNEQFEKVGIMYKEGGKEEAILLGVEFISVRLPSMVREFMEIYRKNKDLGNGNRIAIFCARGGMRSASITGLLHSLSLPVVRIQNGYKGYRVFINSALSDILKEFEFIPIYGKTGSGKTYILNELRNLGEPVLDLEACANHRGSLLGSIGLSSCNSQKMFESKVFHELHNILNIQKCNYVFTEGESKRIGKIVMTENLYEKLINGYKILIETDLEFRKNIIKTEYLGEDFSKVTPNYKLEMKEAIEKLLPYIGEKRVNSYKEQIDKEEFENLIEELMISYYDTKYSTKNKEFLYTLENKNHLETAKELMNYAKINILDKLID